MNIPVVNCRQQTGPEWVLSYRPARLESHAPQPVLVAYVGLEGERTMRNARTTFGFVATFVLSVTVSIQSTLAGASFQGLGDLPGGGFNSDARYLSPDGGTVLGVSSVSSGYSSYWWTESDGMQTFSQFPTGDFSSGAPVAISNDHSIIVGSGQSSLGSEAFRWTLDDGMIGLGDLPGGLFQSRVSAMSLDGSVIVGKGSIGPDSLDDIEAFIWTETYGMVGLGDLPSGPNKSWATDVSADGSVVVGIGTIAVDPGTPLETYVRRAFRWTESDGMVDIGSLAPGLFINEPRVSSDGQIVVAYTSNGVGWTIPFRWTEAGGIEMLDRPSYDLTGESKPFNGSSVNLSYTTDVNADGSVIVGYSFNTGPPKVVVWDDIHGARYLETILTDLAVDFSGWSLEFATGISDDGLTIVGTGINPDGNTEAFIATLPEPGTCLVVLAGLPVLLRRRNA